MPIYGMDYGIEFELFFNSGTVGGGSFLTRL